MLKRKLTLLLSILIGVFVFAQSTGVTGEYLSSLGDKKSYKLVVKENNVEYCETFLRAFPESKYRKKVNVLYDKVYYIKAYDLATKDFELSMLEDYLTKFPKGLYRVKAEEALDIISWQKAKSTNTIAVYEDYLKKFPNGRAVSLAKKAMKELK